MEITRAWIAEFPTGSGRASEQVTLCMRFDKDRWNRLARIHQPVTLEITELPRGHEDHTIELHARLGLLDANSLLVIGDAIMDYFGQNALEKRKAECRQAPKEGGGTS